jgi:hypothetical protein
LGNIRHLLRMSPRLLVFAVTLMLSLTLVPAACASGPGKSDPHAVRGSNPGPTKQDPVWLQAKLAHRVWSGIVPGQGKGTKSHPVILGAPLASYPVSASVYTNGDLYAAEPGSGVAPSLNFPGGGSYDDSYNGYNDSGYFSMCGPGAADVATFDWPLPPNDSNHTESDPLNGYNNTARTAWNGTDVDGTTRVRGYLMYLAFQIHPPTWSGAGMLPESTYLLSSKDSDRSTEYPKANGNYGSMLQMLQDATNYAASGENNSNWASYFYTTQWDSAYYNGNPNIYPANLYSALHSDIQADIAGSGVPVVVEVPLNYLPNSVGNNSVNHFVAIVGYDDNAGTYSYIDTCKGYTHCDAYWNGSTWVTAQDSPDVHTVPQSQLAAGVAAIGTDQGDGDGGWVW